MGSHCGTVSKHLLARTDSESYYRPPTNMTKTKDKVGSGKDTTHKILKSRNTGNRAFVTFLNRTSRVIDIIWINYEGSFKSYTPKGLSSGKRIDLHTYEEHPWIFRDRQTGDSLVFCSRDGIHEEVYFPEPWDGSLNYRAPIIGVILPVYDLKERCLQVVRQLVKKEDVSALGSEIPKTLQDELVHPKSSNIIWEQPQQQEEDDS